MCLVDHFRAKTHDEGVRNVAHYLSKTLAQHPRCEVRTMDIRDTLRDPLEIRSYAPDIVHYVLSPTFPGLLVSRLFSALSGNAKTVVSAPHPSKLPTTRFMKILRPDVVLVQSLRSEEMFSSMGYETEFIPNGVDTERFKPISDEGRLAIRKEYALPLEKFIILHVGSVTKGRNLQQLVQIQREHSRYQVVVVGSTLTQSDANVMKNLRSGGCLTLKRYYERIEDLYASADCYVFPVVDRYSCIETPLSVLEAMSCNLRVASTRFGALPRFLCEEEGFSFYESASELSMRIRGFMTSARDNERSCRTRQQVLPYSWAEVSENIVKVYERLLE